ncbi:hypothetical protein ACH4VQ_24125 [Streptomyces anulatus]
MAATRPHPRSGSHSSAISTVPPSVEGSHHRSAATSRTALALVSSRVQAVFPGRCRQYE